MCEQHIITQRQTCVFSRPLVFPVPPVCHRYLPLLSSSHHRQMRQFDDLYLCATSQSHSLQNRTVSTFLTCRCGLNSLSVTSSKRYSVTYIISLSSTTLNMQLNFFPPLTGINPTSNVYFHYSSLRLTNVFYHASQT